MSYWSHNPEKYDEICRDGIADKIATLLHDDGMDTFQYLTIDDVVRVLYEDSKLVHALIDWAAPEIACFETDYWGQRIDEAKDRLERDRKELMEIGSVLQGGKDGNL